MNMFMELRKAKLALKKAEEERDLWKKRWNTIYNFTCSEILKAEDTADTSAEIYPLYQVKAAMEQVIKYTDENQNAPGVVSSEANNLPINNCQSEEE